jgi:conjugal transfer/type IV secretion protein DotA/TraY
MATDQASPLRNPVAGSSQVQEFYYDVIKDLWQNTQLAKWSLCIAKKEIPAIAEDCDADDLPNPRDIREFITTFEVALRARMDDFVDQQYDSTQWDVIDPLREKGWGAAGIWYNRIAQMNGEFISAVYAVPQSSQMPAALEIMANQHRMQSDNVGPEAYYDMTLPDGQPIRFPRDPKETKAAKAMAAAFKLWQNDNLQQNDASAANDNAFIAAINAIFGTSGIYDLLKNPDVHPLAQLSSLGRGMLEANIRNLGISLGGRAGNYFFPNIPQALTKVPGDFFYSIGMMTLGLSFILFYILPFMPFLYFFFAVSSWVKTIFEAMCAMPLWAIAHITKLDGDGIPGTAAMNGYVLIFEIFLRPILIVVGLIASISIFSALVLVLNDIFDFVVANVSGFNVEDNPTVATGLADQMRAPVDEFFYTVLYTIAVYVIGLSTFKLIDLIPDSLLRWMGQQVKTFQSADQGNVDGVLQRSYSGVNVMTNNFEGGLLTGLVK